MPEKKKTAVPRLRFPEFRDAGPWEVKRLGDVAEIITGNTPSTSEPSNYDGDKLFVSPADISDDRYVENTKTTLSDIGFSTSRRIPPSSVLFVCIGSIGKVAQNRFECATNQQINSLLALSSVANDFLYYVLDFNSKKIAGIAGNQVVPIISKSLFSSVQVPIPSLPEQKKIADCLSSLDDLIRAEEARLEALQAHKKGLMQQLFPVEGETTPRLRFPEFRNAGPWEINPLSTTIAALDAGVSVNSGDRPAQTTERGILKTSAVADGVFNPSENKVVMDNKELGRMKEPVRTDTIIISRMNTPALVGANAYIESSCDNLYLPDRLWAAKPKPGICMRYLAYLLGTGKGRSDLSSLATGTSGSMKNIAKNNVLEMRVLTPRHEEQQKIADCLSSLDDLIRAQGERIEALKQHKKGLMQQLFPQEIG